MLPTSFNPLGLSTVSGYFLVEYQLWETGTGKVVRDWTPYDPETGYVYEEQSYVGDIRLTPRNLPNAYNVFLNVWTTMYPPPWWGGGYASPPYKKASIASLSGSVRYLEYFDQKWINDTPEGSEGDWSNQWVNISFDSEGESNIQGEYIAFFRSSTYQEIQGSVQFKNRSTGELTEWYDIPVINSFVAPDDPETYLYGVQIHYAGVGDRFTAWPPERGPDDPDLFWEFTLQSEGGIVEVPSSLFDACLNEGVQDLFLYFRVAQGDVESGEMLHMMVFH